MHDDRPAMPLADLPTGRPSRLSRVPAKLVAVLTVVVACFAGLDIWVDRLDVADDVVDIQTPSILFSKLQRLSEFDGYKVVLLGDSVVYGRSMADHGDPQWRQHQMAALLQRRLERELDEPVRVMNLAINGALPADLEQMISLVCSCHVDVIAFDLGIRSFSVDFSSPGNVLSRPWLERVKLSEDNSFCQFPDGDGWSKGIETSLSSLLINHWSLYRLRDLLQYRYLGASPRRFVEDQRDAAEDRLNANRTALGVGTGLDDEIMLLMKARNRFQSINLDPTNQQRQALERSLSLLRDRRQRAVIFYAKEHPEQIGNLIEPERHDAILRQLAHIVRSTGGERVTFLPPLEDLQPEHYLDHVHVDAKGHAIYAQALHPYIVPNHQSYRPPADPGRLRIGSTTADGRAGR